jgi:hypothetical protein
MAVTTHRIDYYYAIVDDLPGEGYRILAGLQDRDISLVAFTAFPLSDGRSQLDMVPSDGEKFRKAVNALAVSVTGPRKAFLIQGDDKVGVLANIHRKLADSDINAYAANGVCDGRGGFGYILWVKKEQFEDAATALGV